MTNLLIVVVVILAAIAMYQLSKIFALTQVGEHADNSEIANDNDNKVNGYLMFAFLGFIYIFTIYSVVKWGSFPLIGNSASEHGPEIDRLMWISLIIIFFVQTVTQAFLHYFSFKYYGRKGQKAVFYADNNKLEVIWTIIPAIVLAGLILYGLYAWTNIMFVDEENEDVMIVEIYAKQFGWEVRYAGEDNVLGKANVRYIQGANTLGIDLSDPNAADDIQANEMYLPKDKKVVFYIRSQDVLHSAYMPHFRAQMNCVPGMVTKFAFTPTVTTAEMREREFMKEKVAGINQLRVEKNKVLAAKGEETLDPYTFDYLLLCNKICGSSHYNMQMRIVVVEQDEFKNWISERKTVAENLIQKDTPAPVQETNETSVDTLLVAQNLKK